MKKKPKSRPAPKRGSKTYRKPKVKAYGNIHNITAGTGVTGERDSQSMPQKTIVG